MQYLNLEQTQLNRLGLLSVVEKQNIATAEISYSVTRERQENLLTFERISKKSNSRVEAKSEQRNKLLREK